MRRYCAKVCKVRGTGTNICSCNEHEMPNDCPVKLLAEKQAAADAAAKATK